MDEAAPTKLETLTDSIGITSFTLEDDVFLLPAPAALRRNMRSTQFRPMVVGDIVRDWIRGECDVSVFPYDSDFAPIPECDADPSLRYLWMARTCLANNKMFGGKTKVECGMKWYEYGRLTADKLRTPLSIVFGEVATHNHFVLDRGGKVFKQTAPVIKLPREASEDDHLALLGLLNSSTACFWMKQVCHNKGSTVDQHGARQRTAPFEDFFAFNGTKLQQFPLPAGRPLPTAKLIDSLAANAAAFQPSVIVKLGAPTRFGLDMAKFGLRFARSPMIAAQEELDWECYHLYGLTDAPLTRSFAMTSLASGKSLEAAALSAFVGLELGQRAFEIVLARKMAESSRHTPCAVADGSPGTTAADGTRSVPATFQTTWFARHGSTPITELPASGPTTTANWSSAASNSSNAIPTSGSSNNPNTNAAGTPSRGNPSSNARSANGCSTGWKAILISTDGCRISRKGAKAQRKTRNLILFAPWRLCVKSP